MSGDVFPSAAHGTSRVTPLSLRDGTRDELLEDFRIDVDELANVEASLAHLVLTEFREKFVPAPKIRQAVDTDVAFSR